MHQDLGYVRVTLGLYWDTGKTETAIWGLGFRV